MYVPFLPGNYHRNLYLLQVYKRRMTALVLGEKLSSELKDDHYDGEAIDIDGHVLSSKVKFGDHGYGKIYSVSCK